MKKITLTLILALSSIALNAQYRFTTTVSTSSSNEYIQLASFLGEAIANVGLTDLSYDKFMFSPQLVFPFSASNSAPESFGEMRGGYARAFSAPWKNVGDASVGISGAWDHYDKPIGFYIGLDYKTKEVAFKNEDKSDRAHYISPGAGIRFKFGKKEGLFLEMGAAYDYAFAYSGGVHDFDKKAVNSGIAANIGIGTWTSGGLFQLNIKLPCYNFYNKNYSPDGVLKPFNNVSRNIGQISLIFRNTAD